MILEITLRHLHNSTLILIFPIRPKLFEYTGLTEKIGIRVLVWTWLLKQSYFIH